MFRVAVLIAAVAMLGAVRAAPQDAPRRQIFRATSDVVPLFVTVTDKPGQLVTGLAKDDFQVFDNGKPQPLTVFESSPQPIRLIVLIDVSGSMAGNGPWLGRATSELVNRLAPGDLARVGIFGREIAISPTFTRDAQALAAWMPRMLPTSAPTPLWAAVDRAIAELAAVTDEGRRVVLVMSDSKDTGPLEPGQKSVSPDDISDRASRQNVMVYGVGLNSSPAELMFGLPDPIDLDPANRPELGLRNVAGNTGGGYFEPNPRADLAATFARVIDELHQQYLLGFEPPTRDGKEHKIQVRLRQSGLAARARKTYWAPK